MTDPGDLDPSEAAFGHVGRRRTATDPEDETETRTIELSGRQLERWEQLREDWSNDHLPAPTDKQMVKSLLDTVEAVEKGMYRTANTEESDG